LTTLDPACRRGARRRNVWIIRYSGSLLPIYFAGLIFARSFRLAEVSGPAIGVNVLGSVLGGWVEYATMAFGIRSLALLALFFYLMSLLMQQRSARLNPKALAASVAGGAPSSARP